MTKIVIVQPYPKGYKGAIVVSYPQGRNYFCNYLFGLDYGTIKVKEPKEKVQFT